MAPMLDGRVCPVNSLQRVQRLRQAQLMGNIVEFIVVMNQGFNISGTVFFTSTPP
jgi:hypothetical protein